ncbi:MAG: hypothetical protein ACRC42_03440 [Mycoplasma sp.]
MSNHKQFEKRTEKWREYRDEIEKISLKLSSPLTNDKKLVKLMSSINSIDESILTNISTNIDLSQTQNFKMNISKRYDSLSLEIAGLNNDLLKKIEKEFNEAEKLKKNYFLLNSDGNLSDEVLSRFRTQDLELANIKNQSKLIKERIVNFPETSAKDLEVLNTVLEGVKSKLQNDVYDNRVSTKKISPSRDLKYFYYLTLLLFIVSIIVVLTMLVITYI